MTVIANHADYHVEMHSVEALNVPAGAALNVNFNVDKAGRYMAGQAIFVSGDVANVRPIRLTNQSSTEMNFGDVITNARIAVRNDSGAPITIQVQVILWISN